MEEVPLREDRADIAERVRRLKARVLRAERSRTWDSLMELVMETISFMWALDNWREFQRVDRLQAVLRKFGGSEDPALVAVETRPDPEAPMSDRLMTHIAALRSKRFLRKKARNVKRKKT